MPLPFRFTTPMIALALAVLLTVAAPAGGHAQPAPTEQAVESQASDSLHAQLARADSLLFDAMFVRCDAERANAFFTEDVEFYHDQTGLSVGEEVREDSRNLARNCPAENGVRRILVEDSVEVYPIEGYGAVQMGVHHFVERGASTSTVGRFVHTWKRVDGEWKLARVISLHETMDADRAAKLRGASP